ncbi:MAG: hypothetical protein AAGA48_29055 [Myxococcota bacterium]
MSRSAEIAIAILLTVAWEAVAIAGGSLVEPLGPSNGLAAVGAVVAGLAVGGALWGAQAHAAGWLLAIWGVPGLLMALAFVEYTTDPGPEVRQTLAFTAVDEVAEIGRYAIAYLWMGGLRRHGGSRLQTMLPVVALWGQAVTLGLFVVVPGVVVYVGLGMLPVIATLAPGRWFRFSMAGIGTVSWWWLVLALPTLPATMEFVVWAGFSQDLESVTRASFTHPFALPSFVRWVGAGVSGIVAGVIYAQAASEIDSKSILKNQILDG